MKPPAWYMASTMSSLCCTPRIVSPGSEEPFQTFAVVAVTRDARAGLEVMKDGECTVGKAEWLEFFEEG